MPKGTTKKTALGGAGIGVGGALGAMISSTGSVLADRSRGATNLPAFGRGGYLTVSADEIVLFKTKSNGLKAAVGDEVARAPRSELVSVEFRSGWLSGLAIRFAGDVAWEFEIARAHKKAAASVAAVLGASPV
jgi:hypothetical protein